MDESITEGMEVEELASVIYRHWHVGAGCTIFIDEAVRAGRDVGVSMATIGDILSAVDRHRGYDATKDVLSGAFVPRANVGAVCDLLDQIESLCVVM